MELRGVKFESVELDENGKLSNNIIYFETKKNGLICTKITVHYS